MWGPPSKLDPFKRYPQERMQAVVGNAQALLREKMRGSIGYRSFGTLEDGRHDRYAAPGDRL